jgi:hypothetical protein
VQRVVEPELLDSLPPGDRRAIQSRLDLEKINAWMGNHRVMARALRQHLEFTGNAPVNIADLGGGDGAFAGKVVSRLPGNGKGGTVTIVDRHPSASKAVLEKCTRAGWQVQLAQADVFDWLKSAGPGQATVVIANLFLHHFKEHDLKTLLCLIASKTRLFVAVEPRRSMLSLYASRLLGLIGCNEVTKHDALISIRAGFANHDLSRLWNDVARWQIEERPAGVFGHLFCARLP